MIIFDNTSGERNRQSKLTNEQVEAIRIEYRQGKRGRERAKHYGICIPHYNRIGRREVWQSVS